MRTALFASLAALSALAPAQVRTLIRIPVRHADPYAIKAMLEGKPIVSPEVSTIMLRMGQTGAAAAMASGADLLMGGVLFVNPTDNSLWWYPKPEPQIEFLPFSLIYF